jgi:hypothetical protein
MTPNFDCENSVVEPEQQQNLSRRDKASIIVAFGSAVLIGFFIFGPIAQQTLTDAQPKAFTGSMTRREMLARAGASAAAVLGASQSANAKAGQFGKFDTRVWGLGFDPEGFDPISTPYQKGGGNKGGAAASFGYTKSEGAFLSEGWKKDLKLELAVLAKQEKIVKSQGPRIEAKTWFLARDDLRQNANTMKNNMKRINSQCPDQKKAKKAYSAFVEAMNAVDVAMVLKEPEPAKSKYAAFIASYDAWKAAVGV